MQPIPSKHKVQIAVEGYFKRCIVCKSNQVQIHHVFTYGGKQISEMWNYSPVCPPHHAEATPHNTRYVPRTRYYIEWCTLMKMEPQDRASYPKVDWLQMKKHLDKEFL